MHQIKISVIIPTYNDWERLEGCLNALSDQSLPANYFEIIVVNNKEQSTHGNLILPLNCTIIDEFRPGSYAARNEGIRRSRGKILAFTDSDCVPDRDWLSNALAYMKSNPDVGRVAGNVNLFYRSPRLLPVELYEKIYAFDQELYVSRDCTSVTANLITYRRAFDHVGLFNDKLMSGGDNEWSHRAQKAGVTVKYVSNIIVNHPARYQLSELTSKARRVGGGQAVFGNTGDNRLLRLVYDLRPPLNSISLINRRGSDMNIKQKSVVFFMRYYLSVITAFEKFKVRSGKQPQMV